MQKIKAYTPPSAKTVGVTPSPVQSVGVVVNAETGTIEWDSGLNQSEILALKIDLNVDKPNIIMWNAVKSDILNGLSIRDIEIKHRGKRGYSEAQIKRVSAALSRVNAWNRNTLVSKNK